jgi:urea-proton symporter
MAFTVLWRRQNRIAAFLAPLLGLATGLAVWLSTAYHFYGGVTVSSTGQVLPCLYGTVASGFSPIPYSIVITFTTGPQSYDWADFQKESLALERLNADLTTTDHDENKDNGRLTVKELKRWGRIAAFWSVATFLGHWVIWPLPMYGSRYVFSKGVSSTLLSFLLYGAQVLTIHLLHGSFSPHG